MWKQTESEAEADTQKSIMGSTIILVLGNFHAVNDILEAEEA